MCHSIVCTFLSEIILPEEMSKINIEMYTFRSRKIMKSRYVVQTYQSLKLFLAFTHKVLVRTEQETGPKKKCFIDLIFKKRIKECI